jgi:DNA repair exonuclease SbcCD nuclease subunit
MDEVIKLLFTSDIHLGIDSDMLKISNDERMNTFRRIISIAREFDILMIAGDLFHTVDTDPKVYHDLDRELSYLRESGTEVIFSPGAGDLDSSGKVAGEIKSLSFSHLFSGDENDMIYRYSKGNQLCTVHGYPASAKYDLSMIRKVEAGGINIGLFYAGFYSKNGNGEVSSRAIQREDIKSMGLDFYAMGNNHNFRIFKVMDRIIGVHPGTPEPVSIDETGERYIISIYAKENRIENIRRLSINSIKIQELEIDCSETGSFEQVLEKIEENASGKVVLRLQLNGIRTFKINTDEIEKYRELYMDLIIEDYSVPSFGIFLEEYTSEESIRGEFSRILNRRIEKDEIPDIVDKFDLYKLIKIFVNDGVESLEEYFCSITGA